MHNLAGHLFIDTYRKILSMGQRWLGDARHARNKAAIITAYIFCNGVRAAGAQEKD